MAKKSTGKSKKTIAPSSVSRKRTTLSAAAVRMLGKMPDTQVAKVTGRGRRHVRSKRESLGIPPFQKQVNEPWTKKMVAQLGKASDMEVARNLGVNIASVALQRARRGIPACRDR